MILFYCFIFLCLLKCYGEDNVNGNEWYRVVPQRSCTPVSLETCRPSSSGYIRERLDITHRCCEWESSSASIRFPTRCVRDWRNISNTPGPTPTASTWTLWVSTYITDTVLRPVNVLTLHSYSEHEVCFMEFMNKWWSLKMILGTLEVFVESLKSILFSYLFPKSIVLHNFTHSFKQRKQMCVSVLCLNSLESNEAFWLDSHICCDWCSAEEMRELLTWVMLAMKHCSVRIYTYYNIYYIKQK